MLPELVLPTSKNYTAVFENFNFNIWGIQIPRACAAASQWYYRLREIRRKKMPIRSGEIGEEIPKTVNRLNCNGYHPSRKNSPR